MEQDLTAVFKGKSHIVKVNMSGNVADLRSILFQQLGLDAADFSMKLIYKKILQDDSATLSSLGLDHSKAKVMVLATKRHDVDELILNTKDAKEKHRLRTTNYLQKKGKANIVDHSTPKFTFLSTKVLSNFKDKAAAESLLNRLVNDKGIQFIMQKHEWNVGLLKEISPAQFTILGFNRNKGEEIALRLRTNDLKGFRHYNGIRDVLIHELTHMVHSEHNDKFYALQRQLTQEANANDWNQQRSGRAVDEGRLVGDVTTSHVEGDAIFDDDEDGAMGRYRDGVRADGAMASHRHRTVAMSPVGSSKRREDTAEERRAILANAATKRWTKRERDLSEGCGNGAIVPDTADEEGLDP